MTPHTSSPPPPPPAADPHHVRTLPGGIPIPWLVVGVPLAAIAAILLVMRLHGSPSAATPGAYPVRTVGLLLQDLPDGSIVVRQASDRHVIDTVPPATNAFLRVMLAGLVRERRRENEGERSLPFVVTRWSDGRLTVDDLATHRLIELNAFGPDNAGAFARLLALRSSPSLPAPLPTPPRSSTTSSPTP